MKFLRNNWYWIFSIVIGLGFGSIITMHRVQNQADELKQKMPEVAEQTPDADKPQMPIAPALRKRSPVRPNIVARENPTMRPNIVARNNPALKNIGPIQPPSSSICVPPPSLPPLLDDARQRVEIMLRPLLEAGKVLDWRDDGPYLTPEASQIELKALTGGMNPEEAIAFLEEHGHYNEAILSQVSAHRAFKYLKAIRSDPEKVNKYAEKALAKDPDNIDVKKHLLLYETDIAKVAAGYKEILAKNPNDVGALLNLAYRTHYDDPVGALEYAIKANKLDPTRGWTDIGMVYERLGDRKTAWLYYRKQLTYKDDPLARAHLSWIDAGKSKYPPIYLERPPVPQHDEEVIEKGGVVPKKNPIPVFEDTPWYPELPPDERHPEDTRQTDAEAARAAFQREFERRQAAAQKEFDEFMKWAEAVMDAGAAMETNDFLTQELAAHLRGGETKVTPERLVRAFELLERHGRTHGLRRLKDTDPDLAAEMERFLEEKRHPTRRNNPPNKNK